MVIATGVFGGALLVAGAIGVFRSRRPAGRLLGLVVLAAGGLLLTMVSPPDRLAALAATSISAATLTGLLAVAVLLERVARRDGHDSLDLQRDPLRWG